MFLFVTYTIYLLRCFARAVQSESIFMNTIPSYKTIVEANIISFLLLLFVSFTHALTHSLNHTFILSFASFFYNFFLFFDSNKFSFTFIRNFSSMLFSKCNVMQYSVHLNLYLCSLLIFLIFFYIRKKKQFNLMKCSIYIMKLFCYGCCRVYPLIENENYGKIRSNSCEWNNFSFALFTVYIYANMYIVYELCLFVYVCM